MRYLKLLTLSACLMALPVYSVTPVSLWRALSSSFQLQDQSNNPQVKQQIKWITHHPTYLKDFAEHSKRYIYFILEEIKQQHMPGELALLPLIESDYNPFAYSHAGAAGLWQLMPGTGSGLGVKQNWWYDGRRGIVTSTHAALDYLSYLNHFFHGNWVLSIAAYDSGEGTVQRAVRRNIKAHAPTHFWALHLPHETQAYLPRLLAIASIIRSPHHYGIKLPPTFYQPYFQEVEIPSQIDLTRAAKLAEVSYEELLKLNPGHNRWTTAPKKHATLLLPLNHVDTFKANIEKIPHSLFIKWQKYQVKPGDTLSQIAASQKSRVKVIQQVNKLASTQIKAGQTLVLPNKKQLSPKTMTSVQKHLAVKSHERIGPQRVLHMIQKQDTLNKIARKYHVRPAEILFWNQLKHERELKNKQYLVVWQTKKAKYHTVKNGQTLGHIARIHHTTIAILCKLNHIQPSQVIKPKQQLRVI